MKNIRKLLCGMIMVLTAFAFTGCDELFGDLAEDLAGPENTWCEMQTSVGSTLVNIDIIYVEDEYKGKSTNKNSFNLANGVSIKPGITIVVTLDSESESDSVTSGIFEGLTSNTYLMKNFPSTKGDYGTGDETFSFAGNKITWSTMYRLKKELRDKETQIELPDAPLPLTYFGQKSMNEATDLQNFSWKKLIVQFLSAKLLD